MKPSTSKRSHDLAQRHLDMQQKSQGGSSRFIIVLGIVLVVCVFIVLGLLKAFGQA